MLRELYSIFQNRRQTILNILENQNHSLALEKKHELMGAVCEIELFLKTIDHYMLNKQGQLPPANTDQPDSNPPNAPFNNCSAVNLISNPVDDSSFFSRLDKLFKGNR